MRSRNLLAVSILLFAAVGLAFLVGIDAVAAEAQKPAAVIVASEYPDIQAAFDALPAAGGVVMLPPGEFKLTEPLVLSRSNTRVIGAGAATCLLNCNTEGQPAMIVRPPKKEGKPIEKLWRVQLADFRICGDPEAVDAKSTKPKSGDGLLAEHVNEIFIHNLSVDHNGGHGINLVYCYEDPRVSDSIMTYNVAAGLNILAGHDIVVSANQFEENQDAVRCVDSYNLCMNGNNLDDHLGDGVVIENTYGSVLSGNMIEECAGIAVTMDRDCYGNTISANVIAHNVGGGVVLRDAWGCAVSANTFTMMANKCVVVGPASGRITITGNNFSNSYIGGKVKRDDPATGVFLIGASDVVISGNIFSGMAGGAISTEGECRRIVTTSNIMTDLNRHSEKKLPAADLGNAQETVTADNIIEEGE
jgi:parallel beta-helix repeat protein